MSATELSNIPYYQWRTLPYPPTGALSTPSRVSSRATSQSSTPISSPIIHSHSAFKDSASTKTLKTFLPRLALHDSSDHEDNVQSLHYFREIFQKKEFWDECTIIGKLHYKNKSQHRQAGYFKRLCECRRIISRIKETDVTTLIEELIRKFYSGNSLKSIESNKAQWNSIPHRSTVAFTMTRIIGSILLLKKLQSVLHETYGAFYQLMSKTQFMPLALVAIALCSRLSLVTKAWLTEHVDLYVLLDNWIKYFPAEKADVGLIDYESQLPDTIESIFSIDTPKDSIIETEVQTPIDPKEQPLIENMDLDLGEIIQRIDPIPQLNDSPSPSSQGQSQKNSAQPSKTSFRYKDDDLVSIKDDNAKNNPDKAPSSPALSSKSISKKQVLPDIDDIFGESTNLKVKKKKKKSLGSDVSESKPGLAGAIEQSESNKSKIGSISNFDDIFNFDKPKKASSQTGNIPNKTAESREKPGSTKREIDDIFGSNKKPKKKAKASEIDDIFGSGQKKKK